MIALNLCFPGYYLKESLGNSISLLSKFEWIWTFIPPEIMRETHRMVKHTQTIRRQQARDCLSVFGRFGVGFYDGFRGKNVNSFKFTWKQMLATIAKEVKEILFFSLSTFQCWNQRTNYIFCVNYFSCKNLKKSLNCFLIFWKNLLSNLLTHRKVVDFLQDIASQFASASYTSSRIGFVM